MSEDVRPKRWKRWLKRALLASLTLFVVAVLLYVGWGIRSRSGLESEIERIRASGDPVTLDGLWPPEITPESENAALLYEQASDLFDKGGFELAAQSLGRDVSWADPSEWSKETVAAVRQMVEQCDEALAVVRRAAHMERCRFDPKWGWPPTTPTYHLSMVRQAVRALCWSAALKLRDGDADGALQEARAAFLTAHALDGDRTIIAFLVKQAVMNMSLEVAETVLGEGTPTPESLQAFLDDVEQANDTLRSHLVDAYKGERVALLAAMAEVSGMEELLPVAARSGARPSRSPLAWLQQPIDRSMIRGYLNMVPRIVEIGRADWGDAQPLIDSLETDAAEWETHCVRHYSRILGAMMVASWIRTKQGETSTEARLAVAQVAFALKLHKAEHGTYPEALDALAPEFLGQVPLDPFTGGPLTYVRDDGGFFVYSVGLNGVDDEGLTEFEQEGKMIEPGTDDIAWWCTR